MNYNIKGTNLAITDELRSYAERQLAHMDKFCATETTAQADIELQYLEEGRSGKYRAEFTLSCGGDVYRASAWGAAMHEAIDVAGQELLGELRKSKDKKVHILRHTGVKVKEYLRGWRRKV